MRFTINCSKIYNKKSSVLFDEIALSLPFACENSPFAKEKWELNQRRAIVSSSDNRLLLAQFIKKDRR